QLGADHGPHRLEVVLEHAPEEDEQARVPRDGPDDRGPQAHSAAVRDKERCATAPRVRDHVEGYSKLSAWIGSMRAAFMAGEMESGRPPRSPSAHASIGPTRMGVMASVGNMWGSDHRRPTESIMPTTTPAMQMKKLSVTTRRMTVRWLAPIARRIPISRVRSMIVVYIASSTTRNEITTAMLVKACLNSLRPTALSCMAFDTCATGVIL